MRSVARTLKSEHKRKSKAASPAQESCGQWAVGKLVMSVTRERYAAHEQKEWSLYKYARTLRVYRPPDFRIRTKSAGTDMAWREPLYFLEAFVSFTVRAVCAVTHKLLDPMRFD